jgi:hypothetical protein
MGRPFLLWTVHGGSIFVFVDVDAGALEKLRFSAYIEMMLVWRKSRLFQLRYLGLGPFQVAKSLFTLTTGSAGILHG